jgi:hypothetical protein
MQKTYLLLNVGKPVIKNTQRIAITYHFLAQITLSIEMMTSPHFSTTYEVCFLFSYFLRQDNSCFIFNLQVLGEFCAVSALS